ncbi:hypothetical protein F2Q69_00047294 [Brassica cretica]|uniref:Uncharacterized protein n=1 Tax=Brassica cretica TaxID=69181 RepID=A0A8S9PY22_BRACR|nr:hypothetical protein F2Q69_00047294 [Brassica cretica]
MRSSTGILTNDSSFQLPRSEEDGFMCVPVPSLRPVSIPMESWSPVIIITLASSSSLKGSSDHFGTVMSWWIKE